MSYWKIIGKNLEEIILPGKKYQIYEKKKFLKILIEICVAGMTTKIAMLMLVIK